jgi:predicted RNA polymerase sigma factor
LADTVAEAEAAPALPDHYFRREFGRLVSVLSRRFGVHRVELCEDAVQTALLRAVQSWPQRGPPEHIDELEQPGLQQLASRLPAVLEILYLLFTEGYSSAQPQQMIRRELCEDAIRLGRLLEEHPVGAVPETAALLVLMYLNAARFDARVDGTGGLLVLEEQDRSLWDRELIQIGVSYLHRSARGDCFTRYHAEAAIAAEHCLAPTYPETRWQEIARLYQTLDALSPSPIHTLNRAIAIAEWRGPEAGLALLEPLNPPSWLLGYYLWDATLGELYRRRGDRDRAIAHLTRALTAAPTHAERGLLQRRLQACATGD